MTTQNAEHDIGYFIYDDNKRHKFNITKMHLLMNYFFQNPNEFKEKCEIVISNTGNLQLNQNIISDFISYCEEKDSLQSLINNNNVYQLNMLSQQFLIKSLEDETKKYINENHNDLILQSILSKYAKESTASEEDTIIENLSKYIKEPEFLSLPFHILHRIITSYNKLHINDPQTEEEIKQVLLKFIPKYPKIISIILVELDFAFSDKDYIFNFLKQCPKSENILAPKMTKIIIEVFKEIDSEKLKKAIKIIQNENRDHFDEKTKTLRISKHRNIIENGEFSNDDRFETLIIPGSIKFIGSAAFANCSSLVNVIIENGVEVINKNAFNGCKKLEKVEIAPSVKQICDCTFKDCVELKQINLPELKTISDSLFFGCSNLKEINLPNTIEFIQNHAFYNSGITCITIPDSVQFIGGYVFYNCKCLINVKLPNKITKISDYLFYGCSNLSKVTIPNSVKEICVCGFAYCSSLSEIVIPDSVTEIGAYSFRECTSLSEMAIPKSVKTMGGFTFIECSQLKKVKMPKNVHNKDGQLFFDRNDIQIENY